VVEKYAGIGAEAGPENFEKTGRNDVAVGAGRRVCIAGIEEE